MTTILAVSRISEQILWKSTRWYPNIQLYERCFPNFITPTRLWRLWIFSCRPLRLGLGLISSENSSTRSLFPDRDSTPLHMINNIYEFSTLSRVSFKWSRWVSQRWAPVHIKAVAVPLLITPRCAPLEPHPWPRGWTRWAGRSRCEAGGWKTICLCLSGCSEGDHRLRIRFRVMLLCKVKHMYEDFLTSEVPLLLETWQKLLDTQFLPSFHSSLRRTLHITLYSSISLLPGSFLINRVIKCNWSIARWESCVE